MQIIVIFIISLIFVEEIAEVYDFVKVFLYKCLNIRYIGNYKRQFF